MEPTCASRKRKREKEILIILLLLLVHRVAVSFLFSFSSFLTAQVKRSSYLLIASHLVHPHRRIFPHLLIISYLSQVTIVNIGHQECQVSGKKNHPVCLAKSWLINGAHTARYRERSKAKERERERTEAAWVMPVTTRIRGEIFILSCLILSLSWVRAALPVRCHVETERERKLMWEWQVNCAHVKRDREKKCAVEDDEECRERKTCATGSLVNGLRDKWKSHKWTELVYARDTHSHADDIVFRLICEEEEKSYRQTRKRRHHN